MQGLISIILPLYNSEKFLSDAIQSVLNQDYSNWELLIVNDGSNDRSGVIANSFDNHRIRYFEQENKGVSAARNIGLSNMKGDFFCFLDSDDQLTPQSLSSRLEIFSRDPKVSFVDGSVEVMDEHFSKVIDVRNQNYEGEPFNALLEIDNSCFFGPTWMIRRDKRKTYEFKEGLTHGEDLLFYLQTSYRGGFYKSTNDIVYRYRTGNLSAMSDLDGLWFGYKAIYSELLNTFDLTQRQLLTFKKKISMIMFKSYIGNYRILPAMRVIVDFLRL